MLLNKEKIKLCFDFDNSISLFNLNNICFDVLKDINKMIRYSRIILLPDENYPEPIDRHAIYLAKIEPTEENTEEIIATWLNKTENKFHQKTLTFSSVTDILSEVGFPSNHNPQPIIISINDNPEIFTKIRSLLGIFSQSLEEEELTEEKAESHKSNINYLFNRIKQRYEEYLGQKYPATTIAENVKGTWKNIFETLLKEYEVNIVSRNRFPQLIKLFLQQEVGLDLKMLEKIHIEAGDTKASKVKQIQHIKASFYSILVSSKLPRSLNQKTIYLMESVDKNKPKVIAYWLDDSGYKHSQILCQKSMAEFLPGIQYGNQINQQNNPELFFKIALQCDCTHSLEGIVYIDDNDEEFKEVEELGGQTLALPGTLDNASLVAHYLVEKIDLAVKKLKNYKQRQLPFNKSEEFLHWLYTKLNVIANLISLSNSLEDKSVSFLRKKIYQLQIKIEENETYDTTKLAFEILNNLEECYKEYLSSRNDIFKALQDTNKNLSNVINDIKNDEDLLPPLSLLLSQIYEKYQDVIKARDGIILLQVLDNKDKTEKELKYISSKYDGLPILLLENGNLKLFGFQKCRWYKSNIKLSDKILKELTFETEPTIWRNPYSLEKIYEIIKFKDYIKLNELLSGLKDNKRKDYLGNLLVTGKLKGQFFTQSELGKRFLAFEQTVCVNKQPNNPVVSELVEVKKQSSVKAIIKNIEERESGDFKLKM